ncbi:hypothetical protein MTF65_07555 [Streptomyces sp. APSN-46.1]|uniref:hypothetical protein n=1 Tax=Streptomyces sp. APSN-46.1 TaxID=2929049 RepID=UPI001FB2476B|nr:hypothetical protein [Streptomyces sp. APSN-46.1]MCJ1677196.1 hypothetical protein [Streptomyces sp. APSN-46.1]
MPLRSRRDDDPAGDVVRWAAFSCLLVPVVLVVYGTSFGGAAVATLGLAAVTAACRVLLRQSEKTRRATAARIPAEGRTRAEAPPAHRGRHSRGATGSARGCHASGGISGGMRGGMPGGAPGGVPPQG